MIEKILKETGAMKEGHFLLASGYHSEFYFQAQSLLQYPEYASDAGEQLAALWIDEEITTAVSLAIGGIVLGQEVARHLKVRHIFLERKQQTFSLERGFSVRPGERILLIEDVVTTGGSLKEAIPVLEETGAYIVGITSIVSRGNAEFRYPFKYLLSIDWPKYRPEECPLCAKQVPLYAPGTKQSKKTG
ncbi:MAG: orotate phosphoribosyltransferase [Elusimicrobiota bacterium]